MNIKLIIPQERWNDRFYAPLFVGHYFKKYIKGGLQRINGCD